MSRHAKHYRYSALIGVLVVVASILIAPSAAQASVQRAWAVANQTNDVLVGPDNLPVALDCHVNGDYNALNFDGTSRFVIQEEVNRAIDIGCGNNCKRDGLGAKCYCGASVFAPQ